MSEGANIDFSGLSENEAEEKYIDVEKRLEMMESKRQTQTKEFIELLREKLGLSERLKKFQEVNNCEMRIRFIEARMRGEDMPHTEYVNLQRKERRKRRNKTNTMMLVVIAIFVMMIGSVPMLKMMMEKMHERSDQIAEVEDAGTVVVPPNTPPAATTTTAPPPAATPATDSSNVEEVNASVGGKEVDLSKVLRPGRTTVFFAHSIHCPDCIQQLPRFKQLAAMYPEYKFYTIDVDRPFSDGIDRDSPVCKQFGIDRFPYYMIYDGTQQVAVSKDAKAKIQDWYMARAGK